MARAPFHGTYTRGNILAVIYSPQGLDTTELPNQADMPMGCSKASQFLGLRTKIALRSTKNSEAGPAHRLSRRELRHDSSLCNARPIGTVRAAVSSKPR